MTLCNFAGILCIAALLVVTVSGYSHGSDGYGYIESRLLDSNIFYENAAAMKVDFGSCDVSTSAEEICQTADFKLQETDHPVHVCLKDGKTIIIILNSCTRFHSSCILHYTCMHKLMQFYDFWLLLIAGINEQGLCYYSDVPTCCKNATSLLSCKSVTRVTVGGETTSVTHYQRECTLL